MHDRRKVLRYPFGVAGTLHPAGGGVGTNVVIHTISPLGCAIESRERASVGKKCELYFDWQGAQVGLEAQVAWRDEAGRMGLKFLSVDKDSRKRLNELCAKLGSEPLPGALPDEAGPGRPALDSAPARPPAPPAATPSPSPGTGGLEGERERRRVPRYVSNLPARLRNPSTGETSTVTLVTLSVLGGCLEGSALPEAGKKLELNIEWKGKPLVLQGEIVGKGKEQAGMKFASLDQGTARLLRQICANLTLRPFAPLPNQPE